MLASPDDIRAAETTVFVDSQTVLSISIGTPARDASSMILAAGFEAGSPCTFQRPGLTVVIMLATDSRSPSCLAGDVDKPVVRIYYMNRAPETRDLPPPQVVARLTQEIGAEPSCQDIGERSARCAWHTPPQFPDAMTIELEHVAGWLTFVKQNLEWPNSPAVARSSAGSRFDPLVPLGDIDLLAPSGVAIGMPLADAHAGLTAAGFSTTSYGRIGHGCQWTLNRSHEVNITVEIVDTSGPVQGCKEGAVIREIRYRKSDHRRDIVAAQQSGADMIAELRQQLGVGADICRVDGPAPFQGKQSDCRVEFPPNAPEIGLLDLEYRAIPVSMPNPEAMLTLHLRGVDEQRSVQAEMVTIKPDKSEDAECDPNAGGFDGIICRKRQQVKELNEASEQ